MYSGILYDIFRNRRNKLNSSIWNTKSRSRFTKFVKCIFQAIQNRIDLFTSYNQRWFNANDTRVIERPRNEYSSLEEPRCNRIAYVIIHKMLAYKQTLA